MPETTTIKMRPDVCQTLQGTEVYVDYLRLEDGRIIPVFNGRKVEHSERQKLG